VYNIYILSFINEYNKLLFVWDTQIWFGVLVERMQYSFGWCVE